MKPFTPLIRRSRSLLSQNATTETGEGSYYPSYKIMHRQLADGSTLQNMQINRGDLSELSAVSAGKAFGRSFDAVQYLKEMMQQMGLAHEQEFVQILKARARGRGNES